MSFKNSKFFSEMTKKARKIITEHEQQPAESARKLSVLSAGIAFIAALMIIGFAAILTRVAFEDFVSDDYAVERVPDRIAMKLPTAAAQAELSDTGYRMRTRALVVDADKVGEYDKIEDVYSGSNEDKISKFLYQTESMSAIYDFGDDSEYVAYIDVTGDNGSTEHPQDAVFAYDNTDGEAIDVARYDAETGLAYIPKSFFADEKVQELEDEQVELQVQTLVRYDTDKTKTAYQEDKHADVVGDEPSLGETSKQNTIPVKLMTLSGTASKMAQVPFTGTQFAVQVADDDDAESLSASDIKVSINDGALELSGKEDRYVTGSSSPSISYDKETGAVNVHNVSPATVMNLELSVPAYVKPSMAVRSDIAYAGEIVNPTDLVYQIGAFGQANCYGGFGEYAARTKTIARTAPGGGNWGFNYISLAQLSDRHCAYVISIGNCPSALGADWTANKWQLWQGDCVHAIYPSGDNPPNGGYWKVLDADWNAQMVSIAFFITCDQPSQQEGAIVLNFYAPRNGTFTITKRANPNPSLSAVLKDHIAGAKFGVYSTKEAAEKQDVGKLVKTMTTDANGYSEATFDDGTYWVKEISAPWPYLVSDQIVSFTSRPKSKNNSIFDEDSVPPIQILKKVIPSASSSIEANLKSGGKMLVYAKTTVSSDGASVVTTLEAKQDVSNVSVRNSNTVVLSDPVSDARYNRDTKTISHLAAGETITFTQMFKSGQGWSNNSKLATICTVSVSGARSDMALKLNSLGLSGTCYGIYSDEACTQLVGKATLGDDGVGYYGKTDGQWLAPNTTYWLRETSAVNGYSVSPNKYSVTTARNSQVSVCVADSFTTLIINKESGAGAALTEKLSQFTLKGAKYGVFTDFNAARRHDASAVTKTKDGRDAILSTDDFGKGIETALGEGTYYIAEIPSSITRPWSYKADSYIDLRPPSNIEDSVAKHDYSSKSNGQFLLDETVYEIKLNPGATTTQVSKENIPVKIQLEKQSTRSDLVSLPQFSLEGAVFGIYKSVEDAKSDKTGNYGDPSFALAESSESSKAIAYLYGNKNGKTTVSEELPLANYYIKEVRAPRNYKIAGNSYWVVSGAKRETQDGILTLTVDNFLSSSKYIDGILTNVATIKTNEPSNVTVQVHKDASEVPDAMKNSGNAMSLAGAKFAVYKTYDDAATDKNRLSFNTDDNPNGAKTTLLTTNADGWTNKAIGLTAEECYWVREIEPPHSGSDISQSMYILDSTPAKATFSSPTSVDMTAYKDEKVKPVSITIGKYPISMDAQGRNLHIDHNPAYTGDALEGAIFALFKTRADAEKVAATTNINDVSVIEKAKAAGAVAVMTSDSKGICGTVDNLAWKADGYYVKELKAPTSGCYKLNTAIQQVLCDANQTTSAHVKLEIKQEVIKKTFEMEEFPEYYYVMVEKTSTNSNVLSDTVNYSLEGIHFGIYATYEEADKATEANPGKPLYNLYTKKVMHADKTVHYEATTGVTGPGTFWAKEFPTEGAPKGFQVLSKPVKVTASKGSVPIYDKTPIVPENGPAKVDSTGKLSYKTARDIDVAKTGSAVRVANASTGRAFSEVRGFSVPAGADFLAPSEAILPQESDDDISLAVPIFRNESGTPSYYDLTYSSGPYVEGTWFWSRKRNWHNAPNMDTLISEKYVAGNNKTVGPYRIWNIWALADDAGLFTWGDTNDWAYQEYTAVHPVLKPGYTQGHGWLLDGSPMRLSDDIRFSGGSHTLVPNIVPAHYTISYDANGGTNGNTDRIAYFSQDMPSLAHTPTRVGYTFVGYYDKRNGGTKYYDSKGKSAHVWDKPNPATLYAHWVENSYKVKYVLNAPTTPSTAITDAPTSPQTFKYSSTITLPNVHKFGHKLSCWRFTTADGPVEAAPGSTINAKNLFKNLNPGDTVTITAKWDLNPYYVTYKEGLRAQWGVNPSIVSGTDPRTGKPWAESYQQEMYFDDYPSDGISTNSLLANKYYHSHFTFKCWTDGTNTYKDKQAVQNLVSSAKQTKTLTAVWYPSFDYGVNNLVPNVIPNQPIGGVTIQKVVTGSETIPDLSGIVFELYNSDGKTSTGKKATTNKDGIATFSGLTASATYYVVESSIPTNLAKYMSKSSTSMKVVAGSKTSYAFTNPSALTTLKIIKKPSQNVIDNVSSNLLAEMPPVGAKFAVYASEADAKNDKNRLTFIDENGNSTTIATVSKETMINGIPCAESTISGLPANGTLYVRELAAPDHGQHEYKLSSTPVAVSVAGANSAQAVVTNDMEMGTSISITKKLDADSLAKLSPQQCEKAQSLCDGIVFAIYCDKAEAAKRSNAYVAQLTIANGKASYNKLPYGNYYLVEYSIPKAAADAGIVRSDELTSIVLNATTKSFTKEATDPFVPVDVFLSKKDANDGTPISGVVFDIYDDDPNKAGSTATKLATTSASDANGLACSEYKLLPNKSYFVVERFDSLPHEYNGYGLGEDKTWSGWVTLGSSSDSTNALVVTNTKNNEKGTISITKTSNTNANASGAVFSVYDENGELFGTMTTKDDGDGIGHATIENVPLGTYTVRETTALELHSLTDGTQDAKPFEETVVVSHAEPNKNVTTDTDPVMNYQGYIKVHKTMKADELLDGDLAETYSLAGAVYSLYPIQDGVQSETPLSATLITDEKGDTETIAVPLGKYKVVETTEPANFSTPSEMKEFDVELTIDKNTTQQSAYVVESEDWPMTEHLADLLVEKRSAETLTSTDGSPQGTTNLGGTKFEISYSPILAQNYEEARDADKARHWFVETANNGRTYFSESDIIADESDELFHDSNGNVALPVGTVTVREVTPPTGYSNDVNYMQAYVFDGSTGKFEELRPDNESNEIDGVPVFTVKNDIYRADISFHKVDAFDRSKKMADVPFLLTLLSDETDENGKRKALERHLVVTDDLGDFSSKTGRSGEGEVNENDRWIPGDVEAGCVESGFREGITESRVWFSGSNSNVAPDASKGALIYGDYELREYYRDDTLNYQSLEPIYFSVRGKDDRTWIECNGVEVEDGNLNRALGDIENHAVRITSTEFLDTVTQTHMMAEDSHIATETIKYADATPGESYTFEITAFDADTKEPIIKTIKDIDGEMIDTQAGAMYELPSAGSSGTISIDISFEGYEDAVRGKKVGLVTRVYHGFYLSDKHNENLEDDNEAVQFAIVSTMASDFDTEQQVGFADGRIDITDVVEYHNLLVGKTYEISGILMDKVTGLAITDINGNTITATDSFTAETRDGTRTLSFSFEVNVNEPISAVAFETISMDVNVVASHKDIEDEDQSVYYPSVGTTAKDGITEGFTGNAEGDRVSIIDTIAYDNLAANKKYDARGYLYTIDDEGNINRIDGSETTLGFETSNAPSDSIGNVVHGTVDMTFVIDSSIVKGKRILVAEEIYADGKIIAKHDDVSFEDQIVSYPSVGTTASDITSGLHVGNGEDERELVDLVELHGLKPGMTYTISGKVVGKDANNSIIDTAITAEKTFIAEKASEKHRLVFKLPATFPAESAVAYEYLSDINKKPVAKHEDPNDEDQTVHYPWIGTTALHPYTETHVGSNIDNRIVDTVEYHNLVPGYEYEVSGLLADKETGEFVTDSTGKAPISGSTRFVPNTSYGFIDVKFELGDVDVSGKTIVVFEQMNVVTNPSDETKPEDKTLVATHCDIESDSQSVLYPSIATTATDEASSTHLGSSLVNGTIIDVVAYNNLVVGYEYEVTGTLMDKETGLPIIASGEKVTASTKFIPTSSDGEVKVTFTDIPASSLADKTVVVFEKLSLIGFEIAHHNDLDDSSQSVCYPSIRTTATDNETGLHEGYAAIREDDDGYVYVSDTVMYKNIAAGETYEVSGILVDKLTGDSLATSSASFVASAQEGQAQTSGNITVEFKLKKDDVYGRVLVAFEKLYDNTGREIANHEDVNDEDQTVAYPKIGTTALDGKTLTHAGSLESLMIVDTIQYEGLLEGHSYTAYGTLMDKETGEAVVTEDGVAVSASADFIAGANGKGSAEVVFNVSSMSGETLRGKTFVAFEKVCERGDEQNRVIAEHEDIEDEDQSVHYPSISTVARNIDNTNEFSYLSDVTIIDTIIYENLVPGVEYQVTGELMNKWREDVLLADGKAVTSATKFIPSSSNGTTDVIFEFYGPDAEQCVTVAFERLYVNDALVAEHTDLEDEYQTMNAFMVADELIDEEDEELPLTTIVQEYLISQTGDEGWRYAVLATCMALSIATVFFMRWRLRR